MTEARLEDSGAGLAPTDDGWFVVNARDTAWLTSETFGSGCVFESREHAFRQLGINLNVLEPGEPNCLYHSESQQEAFLANIFDSQSSAFYTSGHMLDDGMIDPRDTRRTLGFLLETVWETRHRVVRPNSFGIARM